MKQIVIKFVNDAHKRIGEPVDWWFDKNGLQVRINDMGDWRYNFLCGRHEMDEAILCAIKFGFGMATKTVDDYCKRRDVAECDPDSLSGYPGSPHQQQHNDALLSEWVMSRFMGVDWEEYGKAFDKI